MKRGSKERQHLGDQPCSKCGMPWQKHYKEGGKWKMGPFGTFDLRADHVPHIPGLHAVSSEERDA